MNSQAAEKKRAISSLSFLIFYCYLWLGHDVTLTFIGSEENEKRHMGTN